jgi:nitrite reductase (NADH) small subunit
MPHWVEVCSIEDIPLLGSRIIYGGTQGPIAVFRNSENEIFAILDRCPHKGGPLSQGIVHGHAVTCPLHNWTIDLTTGCAQAPDVGCVTHYLIKVDHNKIFLDQNEMMAVHE